MTRLLTFTTAALIAMAPNVLGDPYWIGYEGNDFPENEGWRRIYGNEDGYACNLCLTLRSRAG